MSPAKNLGGGGRGLRKIPHPHPPTPHLESCTFLILSVWAREREGGWVAGQQADDRQTDFRLGQDRFGSDREINGRDKDTDRHRTIKIPSKLPGSPTSII
jgi:hypothetical protein